MPTDRDNIEPVLSDDAIGDQEASLPEPLPTPEPIPVPEPAPVPSSKWNWVGSPSRPEAQEKSDGISDLFTVSAEDVGASDEDLNDLTEVDIEHDVIDADEDGSLDDLTSVTEDDIMGDETGQRPSKPASRQRQAGRRITPRYIPPTSMRRSG